MSLIRVAALGLGDWELNFLQATLGVAAGIDIAQWTFEADPGRARVVLVNATTPEGSAWLQRRGAAHGDGAPRPIIVACVERATVPAERSGPVLGLPMVHSELIALLRTLESDLHAAVSAAAETAVTVAASATTTTTTTTRPWPIVTALPSVGSVPDNRAAPREPAPEADPVPELESLPVPTDASATLETRMTRKAHRRLRFYEGTRFLGLVRRAYESGRIVEIRHARFPRVTIFPMAEAFTCAADPAEVPELFRAPAAEFVSRPAEARGAEPRVRLPRQRLVRLVYCAAYFGAEGRLPERAEPDDRLELIGAPDFSLLPHGAAERAIAQFLARGPARLQDVAAGTDVPLDAVVDFMNGCEAIGIMRRLPRDAAIEPATSDADAPVVRNAGTLERLRSLARSLLSGNGEG